MAADPPLAETSSGYRGSASDPWNDLREDGRLTGYDASEPGNVVQGARTALDGHKRRHMTLAISFGRDGAGASATAAASLRRGFAAAARSFDAGWDAYRSKLKAPPKSVRSMRRLYTHSVLVLAGLEDKQHGGASIASPSMPWIWGTLKLEPEQRFSGPYHLVWPRDLYHASTALKAAGDGGAARRSVEYLWEVQKPEGDWWQNTRVDGTKKWETTQMDQVALPIVLAWWLGMRTADDWSHVEKAADYIVANGPESPNERWENQSGYSPNTIAAEIAGLVCAADIARRNGDADKAAEYERVADEWRANVERWTATTNGPYSPKPYYLRVTKDGEPDNGMTYSLGDNFDRPVDQREIVDNSFLALTLFGIKPWDDRVVRNSLAVGDRQLAEDTPSGTVWHRFTFDGYGEQADGGDWDLFDTAARQTRGRLWPLLTGERGEYELLAGRDARAAAADDRQHRQRRPDAARAGVGRADAARREVRQGDAGRDAARVDARARSCGWRGRSTPVRRSSSRASSPAATCRAAEGRARAARTRSRCPGARRPCRRRPGPRTRRAGRRSAARTGRRPCRRGRSRPRRG